VDDIVALAPMLLASGISRFNYEVGVALLLIALIWALFYVFMSDGFRRGQSYGKNLLGIRVVDAKTRMSCTSGQSFVRNLFLAILGPIDWVFIFGARHQRLGDKAAGTVVIVAVFERGQASSKGAMSECI